MAPNVTNKGEKCKEKKFGWTGNQTLDPYITSQYSSMQEMSDLQLLNEEMDAKLILFFDTLTSLYQEQEKLNDQIKDGFWNMSRARYSMGVKFVGIDQIHEDDMQALTKVKVTEKEEEEMFAAFANVGITEDETSEVENVGVRKRNVGKSEKDSSLLDKKTTKKTKQQHDPMKWFGVLVPPSLRQCQKQFKSSLETTIAIANLKQKLLLLKSDYSDLKRRKAEITSKAGD
ncbi:coiled-coil domain-containing protein 115-like [Saccostrea echinata]|uniref:coiled-coil domain-containing protein 115-like n=1 Tax=Saccostrea echinata TaxID=191078 RepID=UPI002A81D895|nr:coiled-coil domain-containing protein 115-like [Saccostrea echinata]